ncbi:MAG: tRNA 2-thiouridine(34) synthase MnmA [Gammaproteobacteria bacterium]|nr:tRNA 2-thiouridine(34) synthase MnmA [Gammaproteobacteria bacterium]NND40113.1 tRNA 2-thiouridine(34) synthase MnmA [Pseudomonadales bacterium]MBT8151100.1 tRNA 2-thiouridine(34) synthase MnmA [Gammaproteobacteria bacterium]NNL10530.1 tRNA 2-thiouridine(34) synthase MnmA [Pseudomonadales bacterium]NNM12418.1 tRNA 2-thiouridine(34) synthase MnmA [Pseudomonadales bacterium]
MNTTPDTSQPAESGVSRTVMIGLSGGVDSAVAALRLKQQGYRVEAMFMKNWEDDDGSEYCTARQDFEDAMRVADLLQVELHPVNFAREYWDNVFSFFLQEYKRGRTPNPDVMCNREIKFKVFRDHALELGAQWIATGHYARTGELDDGGTALLKAADENKDQTYFLHSVAGEEFARTLFPLGELQKPAVRKIAEQAGLHNFSKKDSTGICFIGERRFSDFLQTYLPANPGPINDLNGRYLGDHKGLMYHTIGQRQGLGIGGLREASDAPWYVAGKDLPNNTLIVVQGNDHPALFKRSISTEIPHWINRAPALPLQCAAKIRYRQLDQQCSVSELPDGGLRVEFDQPQRAVTPGQYAVFYDRDRCLGGAVIKD